MPSMDLAVLLQHEEGKTLEFKRDLSSPDKVLQTCSSNRSGAVMGMIMETRATRSVLRAIIQRDYRGSQADFSQQCDLDTADTSRVIAGIRSATLGFVRRATGVLGEKAAAELITAFLSVVTSGVTDAFSVTVTITAKGPTTALSARRRRGDGARATFPSRSLRRRFKVKSLGANERHDEVRV